MTYRSNNSNKQSGQSGKKAGVAAAVAAGSAVPAFGAGYGGAAVYDNMQSEPVETPEELTVEEDVEVYYDEPETFEHPTVVLEPMNTQEQPLSHMAVNQVPVVVTQDLSDINTDDVTTEILAEEMVDPTDIDAVTAVEFTSLNTRYDADGNEMTVAYFRNNRTGADMMLVDNNGDGTFDYVADTNGNYYSDTVMGTVFTVDDVEAQISDSTYLAANTTPEAMLESGESFLNDIITV